MLTVGNFERSRDGGVELEISVFDAPKEHMYGEDGVREGHCLV